MGIFEKLFLVTLVQLVVLSLEADNPHEADAVITYLGHGCLGYARTLLRRLRPPLSSHRQSALKAAKQ